MQIRKEEFHYYHFYVCVCVVLFLWLLVIIFTQLQLYHFHCAHRLLKFPVLLKIYTCVLWYQPLVTSNSLQLTTCLLDWVLALSTDITLSVEPTRPTSYVSRILHVVVFFDST